MPVSMSTKRVVQPRTPRAVARSQASIRAASWLEVNVGVTCRGTLMCGARPEELARAHACVSHLWAGAGPRPERGQRNIQWRGQRLRGLAVVAAGRNREPAGLGTVRSVNARSVNARSVNARSVNARSVNARSVNARSVN